MLKKLVFIFAVCTLVGSIALAAGYKTPAQAKMDPAQTQSAVFNTHDSYSQVGTISYTLLDSCGNVYSIASTGVYPLSYEPYSGVVAMVHRSQTGYGGNSGNIFYNYSTNKGATWTAARVGPMAAGLGGNNYGRYPSIVLNNANKRTSKDSVLVEVMFPWLINAGAGFGGLIYATDPGVGANSPLSTIDTAGVTWSSQFTPWTSTTSADVWFAGFAGTSGILTSIFHASDGVTFTKSTPKQFKDSVYKSVGTTFDIWDYLGAYEGHLKYSYFGNIARFTYAAAADTSSRTLGVSTSTDMGKTWTNFDIVNWHAFTGFNTGKINITDLANSTSTNINNNRFVVDSLGGIHWATVFIDTTVKPNKPAVYDVYKAAGGTWTPVKVRDLPTHVNYKFGTLNQTEFELQAAVSVDGKYVAFKWIEDQQATSFQDSTPIPDIFVSVWNIAKKTWTTPENVTGTPTVVDQVTYMAPVMDNDGTIYLTRAMEIRGADPLKPVDTNPAFIYFAKYTVTKLTGVGKTPETVAGTFNLSQNFPNPFNPSTQINFTLPVSGQASLKVYNMLGQEVTTLLSGFRQAGSYFVTFDASKLASGVYLYKLQSGSYSSTKKMVLMK